MARSDSGKEFLTMFLFFDQRTEPAWMAQTPPNLAERRVDSPPIPAKMHHSLQFVQSMQRLGSVTRPRMGGVATGWAAHMQSTSRWAFT